MARILVVDTDADARDMLVTLAEHRGHEALEASDGAEGLRLAREVHPALIVTAIRMSSIGGPELVRRLRADPQLAPIEVAFCVARHEAPEAARLAEACGVTRILGKPVESAEYLRLLDEVLGR